LIKDTIKVPCT